MKIFISSTFEDLKDLRRATIDYLSPFPIDLESMEVWGSSNNEPLDRCLEKVRESDIYLGIIGHRYGYVDERTGKSITELEYLEAEKSGIDRLLLVMSDDYSVQPKYVDKGEEYQLLKNFKSYILDQHYVSFFNNKVEFMEKLNFTFKDYLESTGFNERLSNLDSVWDSITESLENSSYPNELRMRLDNMKDSRSVLHELESVIDGMESAHKYMQDSFGGRLRGKDWEMFTLFPNRIMNVKKIMYSLRLASLIDRAMSDPWSEELNGEIESVKSVFKSFVETNGYID